MPKMPIQILICPLCKKDFLEPNGMKLKTDKSLKIVCEECYLFNLKINN